jgi:pimeloyl-ACP methyl ester carboxylesterase
MGPVHYTEIGKGPAVLLSHGGGGGSDHGKIIFPYLYDFCCITPSRFGYLYTPMPDDKSPKAQADAHAALLKKIGIKRAAILASSGGGPSALHFAAKYPDMCSALILVSAIARPLPPFNPVLKMIYNVFCTADFLSWTLFSLAGASLVSAANTKASDSINILDDQQGYRLMKRICRMAPTNMRRRGTINDVTQCRIADNFAIDKIDVPTLVIHGTADPVVPYSQAGHIAKIAKDSELVPVEGGGHLCIITHREEIFEKIKEFLSVNASA